MTTISRLFAALVAFWLVAGTSVFACVKIFPKEQMDYLAVGAIVLGLVAAGTCWRRTRNWGPRSATREELDSGLDVHLGYPFLTFMAVLGAITFGMMALFFWIQSRRFPKRLDPDGMTVRNGSRFRWNEVTEISKGIKRLGGVPINKWWELRAGKVKASIVPNSLAEGKAVQEFLARHLDLMTFGLP